MNFRIIENDEEFTYAEFLTIEETCFPKDPYRFEQFKDIQNHFYLVTRNKHKAVGYCYTKMHGDSLYIHRIAVLDEYRRQGVGKAMMERTIEHAENCMYSSCMLTVDAVNIPAYELYIKMGFKELQTKFRYSFSANVFERAKDVYCVKKGDLQMFDVFFYIEDERIGSCRYNVSVGGCKDFRIKDPAKYVFEALSALAASIIHESGKIYVMTDDADVANVLNRLRFENKKFMKEMVLDL